MVVRNRKLAEANHRRQQLVRQFYELLEEMERRPVRRQPLSGFPFILLERFIGWALEGLERVANRLVVAAFKRIRPPGGRQPR